MLAGHEYLSLHKLIVKFIKLVNYKYLIKRNVKNLLTLFTEQLFINHIEERLFFMVNLNFIERKKWNIFEQKFTHPCTIPQKRNTFWWHNPKSIPFPSSLSHSLILMDPQCKTFSFRLEQTYSYEKAQNLFY